MLMVLMMMHDGEQVRADLEHQLIGKPHHGGSVVVGVDGIIIIISIVTMQVSNHEHDQHNVLE